MWSSSEMLVIAGATIVETMMLLKPVMAKTKVTVHFVRLDQLRELALSVGLSKVTSNRSTLVLDPEGGGGFFSASVNSKIGGG